MSRRIWLTLLLIFHFLPWPGSDMLFSSLFPEAHLEHVCADGSGVESDHLREVPVLVSHGYRVGSEELLVICEVDGEGLKSESEGENDGKSDFEFTSGSDSHNANYSLTISTQICLCAQILTGIKLSNPFNLRC